jgi:virulence-associated protein VapD
MALYAIAFDLDTTRFKNDRLEAGRTEGQARTDLSNLYQTEIPQALSLCGFTAHPQGSLYHTEADQNPITAIMRLQNTLKEHAQRFCQYVKRVHVFRMDEWSDVTELIAEHGPGAAPTPEEELEEQEAMALPI